jgi:hypothetical protein
MGMQQREILLYPMLPNFLKGISFSESSQTWPAFHFERSTDKANRCTEWRSNNRQTKTKSTRIETFSSVSLSVKNSSGLAFNSTRASAVRNRRISVEPKVHNM